MRYYNIQVFQPNNLKTPFRQWTSFPNGQNDPGALDVMLDIYAYDYATPQQQAVVQIRGVAIGDISQANNFTNYTILVYAGFQAGLPLNNASQAGPVLQGTIFQAFGNWQGVEMTLDFVVITQGAIAADKSNISFVWPAGSSLKSALASTLSAAFPGVKQNIAVSPNLVLAHTETGVYQSMPAFAQTLKAISQAALGGTYPGVSIVATPTQINVFDGTTIAKPQALAFTDFLGQPVWIGPYTIQFVCPMRADLSVGSFVSMPQGLLGNPSNPAGAPGAVVTTSASQPQARQSIVFQGSFSIVLVHHMGVFRDADGLAWVTVFNANISAPQAPLGTQTPNTVALPS